MNRRSKCIALLLAFLLSTPGCATSTTASHFTSESPMLYSGTRLDVHAVAHHEDVIREYKDKHDVEPPAYPNLDLPFSLLLDTIILIPIVLPFSLYQAVFG